MYFTAVNGANGYELWKSNGTPKGTVMVKDIIPGSQSGFPRNFYSIGNRFVFTAFYNGIEKLWESDGTETGTKIVYDGSLVVSAYPVFTQIKTDLYFVGSLDNSGFELLKYNTLKTEIITTPSSDVKILLYPNPSNGIITVRLPNSGFTSSVFSLFDNSGNKIFESKIVSDNFQIDLSKHNSGVYFYEVRNGTNTQRGKIILMK